MDINEDDFETIKQSLSDDVKLTATLYDLLKDEREHLRNREFAHLNDLAEKKIAITESIKKNNQLRVNLIAPAANASDPAAAFKEFMQSCPADKAQALKQINLDLEKNLSQCRELNLINSQVTAQTIDSNKELIDMITGRDTITSTYDAVGKVTEKSNSSTHKEA